DRQVYPAMVEVRMSRIFWSSNPIAIHGNLHLFGINLIVDDVIEDGDGITLQAFAAPGEHSEYINITLRDDSPAGLLINEIAVYGNGATPFPSEIDVPYVNCELVTPTPTPLPPTIPPSTSTHTLTPSITPTPSETLTPSQTLTPSTTPTPSATPPPVC